MAERKRCAWIRADEAMARYHDEEWGMPLHEDKKHFEFLVLDAFQAGLSWRTVLHKRAAFRAAFKGFDPAEVARFDGRSVRRLLGDAGIIRHRGKIEAAIANAKAFLAVQEELGAFDDYVWQFTDGRTIVNAWKSPAEVPPRTAHSDAMSKALKGRGFAFVGSTICYAYMQAAGMVNDHVVDCFRYPEVSRPGRANQPVQPTSLATPSARRRASPGPSA